MTSRISLLVFTAAAALATVGECQAQTTLRYQFKAGDKTAYTSELKAVSKFAGGGTTSVLEQNLRIDFTAEVLEVKADGSAKLLYKAERIRMASGSQGAPAKVVDSEDPKAIDNEETRKMFLGLKDKGVQVTLNGQGELTDLVMPGGLASDKESSRLIFQLYFEPCGLRFPTEGVRKGQAWKGVPLQNKNDAATMAQEQTFTLEGETQRGGQTLQQIAVQLKTTIDFHRKDLEGMQVSKAKGVALFNNATGRLVEVTLTTETTQSFGPATARLTSVTEQTHTLKPRAAK